MAKKKSKTFKSNAEGPISVSIQGREPLRFAPGEVRTHETDEPEVIAALSANPDLSEVKGKK
jgi:hypothetical protein